MALYPSFSGYDLHAVLKCGRVFIGWGCRCLQKARERKARGNILKIIYIIKLCFLPLTNWRTSDFCLYNNIYRFTNTIENTQPWHHSTSTGFLLCLCAAKQWLVKARAGFNRVNERGATVWNTAQVSISLLPRLTTLCPAVPAKEINSIMQLHPCGYMIAYCVNNCYDNHILKVTNSITVIVIRRHMWMFDLQCVKCPSVQLLLKHRHSQMWFVLWLPWKPYHWVWSLTQSCHSWEIIYFKNVGKDKEVFNHTENLLWGPHLNGWSTAGQCWCGISVKVKEAKQHSI